MCGPWGWVRVVAGRGRWGGGGCERATEVELDVQSRMKSEGQTRLTIYIISCKS